MAMRSGWVLLVALGCVTAAGCSADDDGERSSSVSTKTPRSTPAGQESSAAASQQATPRTGTTAPDKGEPGFEELPECFNRRATILGSQGDDRIVATQVPDVIVARGGDDVVTGLAREDRVCMGGGDDTVRSTHAGFPSIWPIDLGPGDDRLRVVEATEVFGGPGRDRIVVARGPGELDGGAGADYVRSLMTRHPSYPQNGPCLRFLSATGPVHVNLGQGWARGEGRDRLINFRCLTGSRYGDRLVGSADKDGIVGGPGYDLVRAGAGNDQVDGGDQADRLYLGPGSDYGLGNLGWDRLYGEDGNDNLEGWSNGDYLDGGAGNDQIYAALLCSIGGNSYDTAGLMDSDPNELFGGPGDDYLVGDKGNDRLDGGEGYDVGQGGYRDGRIDWIESVDRTIDGCLPKFAN